MNSRNHFSPELPDHLLVLLEGAQRRMGAAVTDELNGAKELHGLRGSHGRLLQMVQPTGSRVSDLAEMARTTKQAVGQLISAMEEAGLVTSSSDAADGRVRLVRRTPKGNRVSDHIQAATERAEATLRAEVGAKTYDAMRRGLQALSSHQFDAQDA